MVILYTVKYLMCLLIAEPDDVCPNPNMDPYPTFQNASETLLKSLKILVRVRYYIYIMSSGLRSNDRYKEQGSGSVSKGLTSRNHFQAINLTACTSHTI
jgi:hypothetical protein